ncbi:MAG TPA: hypothetical protein VKQ36_15370 [Ktedonobacterales bacterium]|nr:hypothetical protein [Ktedonobacterales bacterium]
MHSQTSATSDKLTNSAASELPALGIDPTWVTRTEPLTDGLSEARLWRLWLRIPLDPALENTAYWSARRVLKLIAPLQGWLSVASEDTAVREVALWASGLLDDLPHAITTSVLDWAHIPASPLSCWERGPEGAVGALLMRDMQAYLMRDPLRTPSGHHPQLIARLLDHLARLHARFWEDPRLRDNTPEYALLTPLHSTLLLMAPQTIADRLALGDANPYLPLARRGWEAFFHLAPPADANVLRAVLADPTLWLRAIAALPRTLIHGDVWGPNMGWAHATHSAPRTGRRLLLLDWALTATAPATFDPLWLCGAWHAIEPTRLLAAYRAHLIRHLAARGISLTQTQWLALADAGYLRTALTCGEAFGRAAEDAPPGAARQRAETRIRWWAQRASLAARRLID